MKTKKAIASLVVIVLVIAIVLSIGVLADQSDTSSYRINGSNVCLRTSPIMYGDNNVLGLVQNGEIMTVKMWVHGIDNFYIWAFGVKKLYVLAKEWVMLNQRLYSALKVLYGCKQLLDDLIKLALVADLTPMTWADSDASMCFAAFQLHSCLSRSSKHIIVHNRRNRTNIKEFKIFCNNRYARFEPYS